MGTELLAPPAFVGDVVDLYLVIEDPAADSKEFCCVLLDPVAHFQGFDNDVVLQFIKFDSCRRDLESKHAR